MSYPALTHAQVVLPPGASGREFFFSWEVLRPGLSQREQTSGLEVSTQLDSSSPVQVASDQKDRIGSLPEMVFLLPDFKTKIWNYRMQNSLTW